MPTDVAVNLSWDRIGRGVRGVVKAEANGQTIAVDKIDILKEAERERFIKSLAGQANPVEPEAIRTGLLELAARTLAENEQANAHPRDLGSRYQFKDGNLCQTVATQWGGEIDLPIANFDPEIVEEIVRDDGVEQSRRFTVRGVLGSGHEMPEVEISAEELVRSEWPLVRWGTQAILFAGTGNKDHLRAAIQFRSNEVTQRIVRTHTGWVEGESGWLYLHSGGAIGRDGPDPGTSVELPPELARYRFDAIPEGDSLIRSVQASLDLARELAPDHVMLPLLATAYRAVMPGGDFGAHAVGPTGSFKTELAALLMQHWGADFRAKSLPANWSSTSNFLEGLAFAAKDALLVVDDFCPVGTATDVARLHKDADRLFRAQGNRSGRQRLRQDGSLKPARPPRGIILSTGEETPKGPSLRARLLIIEVKRDDVDTARLTTCQIDAAEGLYAGALAGFIRWVAGRFDAAQAELRSDAARLREDLGARIGDDQHRRTPVQMADLVAGFRLFLRFAVEVRALTTPVAENLESRCVAALLGIVAEQADQQEAGDPCRRFLSLIRSIVSSGRAHLAGADGREPEQPGSCGWRAHPVPGQISPTWQPQGRLIGWVDGLDLYLNSETVFAECQRLAGDQGDHLAIERETLHRRLKERGFLVSTDERRKKILIRKSLGGARHYVLHVSASATLGIDIEGPVGPIGPFDEKQLDLGSERWAYSEEPNRPGPTFEAQPTTCSSKPPPRTSDRGDAWEGDLPTFRRPDLGAAVT